MNGLVATLAVICACRRPDGSGMAVLSGLRGDRLATAQDCRRICGYARNRRLDMALWDELP
jgi:hypothetical protein